MIKLNLETVCFVDLVDYLKNFMIIDWTHWKVFNVKQWVFLNCMKWRIKRSSRFTDVLICSSEMRVGTQCKQSTLIKISIHYIHTSTVHLTVGHLYPKCFIHVIAIVDVSSDILAVSVVDTCSQILIFNLGTFLINMGRNHLY